MTKSDSKRRKLWRPLRTTPTVDSAAGSPISGDIGIALSLLQQQFPAVRIEPSSARRVSGRAFGAFIRKRAMQQTPNGDPRRIPVGRGATPRQEASSSHHCIITMIAEKAEAKRYRFLFIRGESNGNNSSSSSSSSNNNNNNNNNNKKRRQSRAPSGDCRACAQ